MTEVTKTRDDIIKQAHELALEYRAKYGGRGACTLMAAIDVLRMR